MAMQLDLERLFKELNIGVYYSNEFLRHAAGEACSIKAVQRTKMAAMTQALNDSFGSWDQSHTGLQMISVGDSHAERAAVFELVSSWASTGQLNFTPIMKSVKFLGSPSMSQLTLELREFYAVLPTLCSSGTGSLDLLAEQTSDFRSQKIQFVRARSTAEAAVSQICRSELAQNAQHSAQMAAMAAIAQQRPQQVPRMVQAGGAFPAQRR